MPNKSKSSTSAETEETTSSAPLNALSLLVQSLGDTSARLEKARLIGIYIRTLDDADLRRALHFLAASPFAEHDRRRLQVGPQSVLRALSNASEVDIELLRAKLVEAGDHATLAAHILPSKKSSLTLFALFQALDTLASLSKPQKRQDQLADLLRRCAPEDGRIVVGLMTGEMRMGLGRGLLEDALARHFEVSVDKIKWAHMLVGDLGAVAVMARQGRLNDATMTLFSPIQFMLATPVEVAQVTLDGLPRPFVVEDKFDGIRVQAHIGPEVTAQDTTGRIPCGETIVVDGHVRRVALFSRTHDDITQSFMELVEPLARLTLSPQTEALILDGELLAVGERGVQPFVVLQKRLGRKRPSQAVREAVPVALFAFDLIFHGTELLIDTPWENRRQVLESLPLTSIHAGVLRRADSPLLGDPEKLSDAFAAARDRGHEGLIIKHPQAPYRPGRRGRDWLKMKLPQATLDVVVTAVEVGHGRRRAWLSDYTFAVKKSADDPELLNIGKAYSGLTDKEIETMTAWFTEHTRQSFAHGRVRLVEPKIVIEVACDRVQPSTRHKSGFALRFARILRLRPDKSVDDIDTLETVKALALQHA